MKNYNKDINVRMNISDDLETKRLKHEADKLYDEITEYGNGFSQSLEEVGQSIASAKSKKAFVKKHF